MPGQHPSELAQQADVARLEGIIAQQDSLLSQRGILIRELQGRVAASASVTPPVTSLPASPVDGQEIYYLADATNGVVWHFRYRAASVSPYKWEFVGGSSLVTFSAPSQNLVAQIALQVLGPDLMFPLAGDYECAFSCQMNPLTTGTGTNLYSTHPVTVAASLPLNPSPTATWTYVANIDKRGVVSVTYPYYGVVAGSGIRWGFGQSVATPQMAVARREMRARPIRVG